MEFDPQRDLADMSMIRGQLHCANSGHDVRPTYWCEHISRYIASGQDTEMIQTGFQLEVPIFPTQDIFASVRISDQAIGASALMEMEYTPDIGRAVKIPLGFWNPGEGMMSIRFVILDYLLSKVDPGESFEKGSIRTKCPNGAHSMRSARIMSERSRDNPQWKWRCLWNIVMEKACTPCVEESSGVSDNNFGIDGSVTSPASNRPWANNA